MCKNFYWISLGIFFVICFVLTLMGLKEQATVQNALTIYRFDIFYIYIYI